jgi:hypothetical protein
MSTKFVVVSLVVAACSRKADPPTVQSGSAHPGSGSAHAGSDPWVQIDAAPDTPEARLKRADAALGRVAEIMPKLAKIRHLTFEHDIPREYQSADDFRKYVHAEIAKELPDAKAADTSAALFQLGLLLKPGNLAQLEEQAFTTQAGAYYDPATKKFFLVMVPDNDLMLDTMSAHELTHGLQDQHFDLRKFLPEDGPQKLDDDQETARRFVAEGDATFTMFLYESASMTKGEVQPTVLKMLRSQLEQFAAKSPEDMIKENASGFSTMDPEIKKSIDAMGNIPTTVLVPMVDSYMQGALLVASAFDHGGWTAVDALFTQPPDSTEQALHPESKLYPQRDPPIHVTLPKSSEAELANVVFGELQWQVYFGLWAPAAKQAASEGWGGDRAAVTRRKDGRVVVRIATAWDTPADAQEFAKAYADSLAARFKGATGDAQKDGLQRPGGGKIFMKVDDKHVFVVDGADDAKDLAALAKAAQFK